MTSIRGSVSSLQPAVTSSSREAAVVCSSLSRRGGLAWVRSRASSLRTCRLWWSRVSSLGTRDSSRYSVIATTTAVYTAVVSTVTAVRSSSAAEFCVLPSASFLSTPLHPADETGWKRSRMWASVWLAAEATNKLVSVCSCRSGSMKPGELGKMVSVMTPKIICLYSYIATVSLLLKCPL